VGPVDRAERLLEALTKAVDVVRQGTACVVDVRVTGGYAWAVSSVLTR